MRSRATACDCVEDGGGTGVFEELGGVAADRKGQLGGVCAGGGERPELGLGVSPAGWVGVGGHGHPAGGISEVGA